METPLYPYRGNAPRASRQGGAAGYGLLVMLPAVSQTARQTATANAHRHTHNHHKTVVRTSTGSFGTFLAYAALAI